MKGLLGFSLALNLMACGVIAYLLANKPKAGPLTTDQKALSATANTNAVARMKKSLGATVTNTVTQKIDWRVVESDDYRQYIANLRSIGCPEETIRDIIVADVNKLFEARRKQMRAASTNKFEFWKSGGMYGERMSDEAVAQKRALAKEKRELLTALLGFAPEDKTELAGMLNPFKEMLDFLPEGKVGQVSDLLQTYQEKAMKFLKDGAPDAEDMKAMHKMELEMDAELEKILTPQEFEDYQLRVSDTAMGMRMELSSFEPNEQEFRDIFKLKKKFDDDFGGNDEEDSKKRHSADQEMKDQLKQVLGADRYADYERSQDSDYQALAKTLSKQGLPKETGIKVFDMKTAAEDEAMKVRSDKSLSKDQRDAALLAIRNETERSITETMGQQAFDAYKKNGAYWLNNISRLKKAQK